MDSVDVLVNIDFDLETAQELLVRFDVFISLCEGISGLRLRSNDYYI